MNSKPSYSAGVLILAISVICLIIFSPNAMDISAAWWASICAAVLPGLYLLVSRFRR